MEFVSWGDWSTPLEATGCMMEAEAPGPGCILGGSAVHRLVGEAPPAPCSPMNAAKHHLKYLSW